MAFNDLREWISALDRAGELKRIRAEVDPVLEITEIADRVSKGAARKYGKPGGPALLFENVRGAKGVPVLINQFGSESRMQLALGVEANFVEHPREITDPAGLGVGAAQVGHVHRRAG